MFTPGKKSTGKMPEIIDMRRGGKENPKSTFDSFDSFDSKNSKKEMMEENTGREEFVDVIKEFETLNFDEQFRPKTQEARKLYEMFGEKITKEQFEISTQRMENLMDYVKDRQYIMKEHRGKFILYHNKKLIHSGSALSALTANLETPGAVLLLVGREGQELLESGTQEMMKFGRVTADELRKEKNKDDRMDETK